MARESIAMSHGELREFLERTTEVVVGTLGTSGEPAGTLAACALVGDELVFSLPDGPGRSDVERDPRVCCTADEYPSYYEIRGMTAHGTARPTEAPPGLARGGAAYAIGLDDVVSFDFGKIGERV